MKNEKIEIKKYNKYKLIIKKMTELIRIPNIERYTQEIINGELVLRPRKIYITENELNIIDITSSKIEECVIKNREENISIKRKYRGILVDIWKSMPTQKILQTTTFNFKLTNENGINGYTWSRHINMSFQDKNASETLKEIINMVRVNKMTMDLSIKLQTDRIVHFKIE